MNTAEIKKDIFQKIDSLPEEKLLVLHNLIINIIQNTNKMETFKHQKHSRIKNLIKNPLKVEKIYILKREEIYER